MIDSDWYHKHVISLPPSTVTTVIKSRDATQSLLPPSTVTTVIKSRDATQPFLPPSTVTTVIISRDAIRSLPTSFYSKGVFGCHLWPQYSKLPEALLKITKFWVRRSPGDRKLTSTRFFATKSAYEKWHPNAP